MSRIRAATAAFLTAAAIVAAAAPAASAQEGGIQEGIERPVILDKLDDTIVLRPCGSTITVPNCVNYALDTASWAVATAEGVYRATAERYVCDVHWILTGDDCPSGL